MAILDIEDGLAALTSRARILKILLFAYMGISTIMVAALAATLALGIDQMTQLDDPVLLTASFAAIGNILLFIICVIASSFWIYRAHANLKLAGFDGLQFSAGWSVGWFFIPFANFFKPYQAMRELWNTSCLDSDGFSAPADQRLTLWWGLWVAGNIILNMSMRMSGLTGAFNVLDVIGYGLLIGAAWAFIQIIDYITRAQTTEMNAALAFA